MHVFKLLVQSTNNSRILIKKSCFAEHSGRVIDFDSKGHLRFAGGTMLCPHCVVSLSKAFYPLCLVLVHSKKTGKCPDMTINC